jgi:Tol biopolymer transport system component
LTTGPAVDKWPSWSRDGQTIYFASNHNSGSFQIWKIPAKGGEAVRITPDDGEGRDLPQESPDEKFIYYQKGWPTHCSVWSMKVDGREETVTLDPVHCEGRWTVWKQGIYFFRPTDERGRSDLCVYEFATGKTSKILTVDRRVSSSIAASPDGRTILWSQYDQSGSDLMLVENFR